MRPNRGGGVGSAAGAVGEHLAHHLRQRARTGPPVFDIAGRHGRGFDQGLGVTFRRDSRRASAAAAGGCGERPREATRSLRFAREAWQAVEELGQGRAMTDASLPPSRPMSPRSDPSARSSAHPKPQACSLSAVPFQGNVMAADSPLPAKGLVSYPEASRCRRIAPVARHDASDDVKARGWTGTCETMASLARRGTPHSDPGRRSHCDRRPACIQTSDETLSRSQSSTRNHNPRRCQ